MRYHIRVEDDVATMYKLVWIASTYRDGVTTVLSPDMVWVPTQPGVSITQEPTFRFNMDWAKDMAEAILSDEPLGQEKLLMQRLNKESERVDKFIDYSLRENQS